MAKLGGDIKHPDPFGKSAIGDALSDLNAADAEETAPVDGGGEGKPPVEAASKPAAASVQKKDAPKAATRKKVRAAKPAAKKTKTAEKPRGELASKRLKLHPEEVQEGKKACLRLSAAVGCNVDWSKMTRALWDVYLRHEKFILASLPEDVSWSEPSVRDRAAMAAFEAEIADLLNSGLILAARTPKKSGRANDE